MCVADLTFIDEGNPDEIAGTNLINFGKRELLYNVIGDLQQCVQRPTYSVCGCDALTLALHCAAALRCRYQQVAYPFSVFDNIASCLNDLPHNNNDDLYALSLLYEPRNATKDQIAA